MKRLTIPLMHERRGIQPRWSAQMMTQTTRYSSRGQVTVETAIGIVAVVGAIVFMAPYVQRAMQGGLFGSTQSLGVSFDNRDGYTETQQLDHLNEHVQGQVVWGMVGAELRPAEPLTSFNWASGRHPDWILSSLPTGSVFREPGLQSSVVGSGWSTRRTASYDDNR